MRGWWGVYSIVIRISWSMEHLHLDQIDFHSYKSDTGTIHIQKRALKEERAQDVLLIAHLILEGQSASEVYFLGRSLTQKRPDLLIDGKRCEVKYASSLNALKRQINRALIQCLPDGIVVIYGEVLHSETKALSAEILDLFKHSDTLHKLAFMHRGHLFWLDRTEMITMDAVYSKVSYYIWKLGIKPKKTP